MEKKIKKAKADDLSDGSVILCPNRFTGISQFEIQDKQPFLNSAKVNIIFWGSAWKGSLKSKRQTIARDVKKILSSSYMRELEQYGIGEPASFNGTFIVDSSEPENGFTQQHLIDLITGMIDDDQIKSSDDDGGPFLHVVMMPRGIFFSEGGPPRINGFHFFEKIPGFQKKLYIACLHFASRFHMSSVFSHELIEACTDPEGTGIRIKFSPIPLNSDREIADICEDDTPQAKVNGVKVQSYWSQSHRSCVIPK
jgi:hypothetical protein